MDNPAVIKLNEVVSGDAAEALSGEILGHRGSPLNIDASEVSRIDTPCIEVLLAASKLWSDEDQQLSYVQVSDNFEGALEILGLQQSMMVTGDSIV